MIDLVKRGAWYSGSGYVASCRRLLSLCTRVHVCGCVAGSVVVSAGCTADLQYR